MKLASTHPNILALHRIDVASPCTASWDKMQGDARVRHCGDCNKNVFNLSAMAEDEAAALLADNLNGELCVRFYRRADGTVMTSDCGAKTRTSSGRAWHALPAMAALTLAAACSAADVPPPLPVTMGAPPPPVSAPASAGEIGRTTPQQQPMMGKPIIEPAPPVRNNPAPAKK